MLPRNHPDEIKITFDAHRLVANADLLLPATSVMILSPVLVRPDASPRSRCSCFGTGFLSRKPLYQRHRSTFLPLQDPATRPPSVDWD